MSNQKTKYYQAVILNNNRDYEKINFVEVPTDKIKKGYFLNGVYYSVNKNEFINALEDIVEDRKDFDDFFTEHDEVILKGLHKNELLLDQNSYLKLKDYIEQIDEYSQGLQTTILSYIEKVKTSTNKLEELEYLEFNYPDGSKETIILGAPINFTQLEQNHPAYKLIDKVKDINFFKTFDEIEPVLGENGEIYLKVSASWREGSILADMDFVKQKMQEAGIDPKDFGEKEAEALLTKNMESNLFTYDNDEKQSIKDKEENEEEKEKEAEQVRQEMHYYELQM